MKYECYMCLWSTPIKTKMVSHIGRKRPCKNINNINLEDCKEYILNGLSYDEYLNLGINCGDNTKIPQNNTINHNITTKIPQNNTINHNLTQKISTKKNCNFECKYCDKTYSRIDSLNRHLKICKEKKKDDEAKNSMNELVNLLNKQNNELKEQLEKQNKQIDELIKKAGINNSTITQNIQNNIKILAYKDTDVSKLTDKDILKCLNHSNMCVPHLIKMIHLDPEKPENHNIYISNIKNNYVMIYDKDRWILKDRDEAINSLIDDKEVIFEQKLEEWVENGKNYPDIMDKFNRYIAKKENNKILNAIKEEIKLMLFNNRDKIQDSKMLT